MIELSSLPATVRAVVLIGSVLLEAIALHATYGALTTVVGSSVRRTLGGD